MKFLENLTKIAWNYEKSGHFEVIVILGRKLCVFFITKFRLFPKKALMTSNLFLVERL